MAGAACRDAWGLKLQDEVSARTAVHCSVLFLATCSPLAQL